MNYRIPFISEATELARIHTSAFKNFFLTELGSTFLETYYASVIKNRDSIAVCVSNEDNVILGFATGCTHSVGYNKSLVKSNLTAFFIQGVKLIFAKPKSILRLYRNMSKNANESDDGNYAELFSIGVLTGSSGLGLGAGLLHAFESQAKDKGVRRIALTTDRDNNDRVVDFYLRNGYTIFYEFTTYPDRKMYKMIKDI